MIWLNWIKGLPITINFQLKNGQHHSESKEEKTPMSYDGVDIYIWFYIMVSNVDTSGIAH